MPGRPGRKPSSIVSDRDEAIVAAHRDGQTLREIAERYGLSRERVRQICERVAKIRASQHGDPNAPKSPSR